MQKASTSHKSRRSWWPIRQSDQVLFAEALSQLLETDVELSHAIRAAAAANPSRRFRSALREMARDCRAGYGLEESLSRTGATVSSELLAALGVGEQRACLPEQLALFAKRYDPKSGTRLAAAALRPPEVARFAGALAGLLADQRLTVDLVEDAGRLAAGGNTWFQGVISRVATAMRNQGKSLAKALATERGTFDPLFCLLVESSDSRDKLCAILTRLGRDVPATKGWRSALKRWIYAMRKRFYWSNHVEFAGVNTRRRVTPDDN
ncbi:MAG: hypothetical protein JWM11_4261 [Planctomycetaceae bacterium]|nr:hypothetical protein [Planctomycetaceae bacterium]